MVMNKKIVAVALALSAVSACAGPYAGQQYQPVIDVYGSPGKDASSYPGDINQCQVLAAERPQAREGLRGAGVGAAIGAATGALGGVLAGKPGMGALLGAGAGGLAGGAGSALHGNTNRQNIVIECMENRGWRVLSR